MSEEDSQQLEFQKFCLGTLDPKCDQCQLQKNWHDMQNLPDPIRLSFQKRMQCVNTTCIDIGYPHFQELIK